MPILDIQKRARELGRIRLGQKGDRGQPQKLDRFRLTSASKPLLEKVAELYGGEVREWTPDGGTSQWEVITDANRLPILVPPQPVTQWHEAWRKSGCVHRCDGRTNVLTDEPCDPEDPLHQEALQKPTTRLNVVLRDVEGIGVWRVESHGWYAALELPDVAQFLAQAGGYVEAHLAMEQRTSLDQSGDKVQTRRFAVPIIEVEVTPAQLLAGGGRIQPPSVEGPVERKAIEAGSSGDSGEPVLPTLDDIAGATSVETVYNIHRFLTGHEAMTPDLDAACKQRVKELQPVEGKVVGGAPDTSDDGDAVWQQIIATAGKLDPPMTTAEVTEDVKTVIGVAASAASAGELGHYLTQLKSRQVQPA